MPFEENEASKELDQIKAREMNRLMRRFNGSKAILCIIEYLHDSDKIRMQGVNKWLYCSLPELIHHVPIEPHPWRRFILYFLPYIRADRLADAYAELADEMIKVDYDQIMGKLMIPSR